MKKIAMLLFAALIGGCATGPYGRDLTAYINGPIFDKPIKGIITVDDQTGYTENHINHRKNPKEEIIREIRDEQKDFAEDPSTGIEYHFIYYKCEHVGAFPTQYEPLNFLIQVGTIGLWPTGVKKNCRVDLEVKDISSSKILNSYVSENEEVRGGNIIQAWANTSETIRGSWRLPARRLIQRHQLHTSCECSASK